MAVLRSRSKSRSPSSSHTTTRLAKGTGGGCAPELLESRRLLSAAYDPATGALTVNGSANNDTIDLNYTGGLFGTLNVVENGVTTFSNFLFNIGSITVHGNAGDDTIICTASNKAADLYGDAGNDRIFGSSFPDNIYGGDGNDDLYGFGGGDFIDGGYGNDSEAGGDGGDVLFGSYGDDRLSGEAGNDVMYADDGNDFLDGGAGADSFHGGAGTDTVDYSARTAGVTVTLDDLAGDGQLLEGDNVHSDVENVNGGYGNDFLFGSASNNYLQGGGGNDVIYGFAGDDVLDGGVGGVAVYAQNTGDDKLYGGDGNDVVYASDYGNNLLHGDAGNDQVYGFGGNDVVYGDAGDDYVSGGEGNDRLYGGAGVDNLWGGNGDDVLVSIDNATTDQLHGDAGNDSFWTDESSLVIFPTLAVSSTSLAVGSGKSGVGSTSLAVASTDFAATSSNFAVSPTSFAVTADTVADASPSEVAGGNVHRVRSFANGADRTLDGDNIADPTDSGPEAIFSDRPLFASDGPTKDDIFQGNVGDCYFLATLSATAKTDPDRVRQHVVDLGDGTYAVEYGSAYVRVDGELPITVLGNPVYAKLGHQDALWVAIMEKAWAYYRTGANTYASIANGWMSEAFSALGSTTTIASSFADGASLLSYLQGELNAGKAVTFATYNVPAGCPCIGQHAYMVERINYGWVLNGGTWMWAPVSVTLRNPWGYDGAGSDSNTADGYVTITGAQALGALWQVHSAYV